MGLSELSDQELHRLGHRNLIAFGRACVPWGEGGVCEEGDGVLMFATASWVPVLLNGAYRTDDSVAPEYVIERADAFFSTMGRGYTIMVRDTPVDDDLRAACDAAGLRAWGETTPEMICRQRLDDVEVAPGVELRAVETAGAVADFAAINADAYTTYGMPAGEVPLAFGRPEAFLSNGDLHAVVAYRDEEPLAAALTLLSDGIAGVYWVGTVEKARGAGLAEAVTRAVTNQAFDRGAAANTLQASVMGEPIYRRMGYEDAYRYFSYVRFHTE